MNINTKLNNWRYKYEYECTKRDNVKILFVLFFKLLLLY